MSILIKGVSFEDFKPFCPCLNGDYGDCDIPGIIRCYGMGKDGCPLAEIPPHGRLIDADVAEVISFTEEEADGKDFMDGILHAADWIRKQPTIVPAEEEEQ